MVCVCAHVHVCEYLDVRSCLSMYVLLATCIPMCLATEMVVCSAQLPHSSVHNHQLSPTTLVQTQILLVTLGTG